MRINKYTTTRPNSSQRTFHSNAKRTKVHLVALRALQLSLLRIFFTFLFFIRINFEAAVLAWPARFAHAHRTRHLDAGLLAEPFAAAPESPANFAAVQHVDARPFAHL